MPRVGRQRPAMGQGNAGHPAAEPGRHRSAGGGKHRDRGQGDVWYPTRTQWERLYAGETVQGVQLTAAQRQTRQRQPGPGARANLEARAGRTFEAPEDVRPGASSPKHGAGSRTARHYHGHQSR